MEYLESSQAEQLREIGVKLSQERRAKSVSLEEVAAKTYIPMRLLNAIEAGRLDLLPEPVFVQGFIRRYADILGLDGGTLSKAFAVEPPVPRYVTEVPQPEAITPPSETRLPDWSALSRRSYLLGGAIGLGVLGLIAASLASRPKVTQPPLNQKPVTSAIVPTAKKAQPKAAISPNPVRSVAPSPSTLPSAAPKATSPVEVKLNLTDESWMEVVVDGKVAYEGTLPKGTQKTWMGKQQVVINSGNAGAVSASYNNGAAKPLGALGAVASVSFPPAAPATGN